MILEQKCSLWTDIEITCLGQSSAPWVATGVSIDSRSIVPGDLFVALRGPNFDGHDFVDQAVAAGAAAAMVANENKDSINVSIPTICLDDTLDGLKGLARLARAQKPNVKLHPHVVLRFQERFSERLECGRNQRKLPHHLDALLRTPNDHEYF